MAQPVVTSLLRGLDVLRCFDQQQQSLGGSEIARLTGLPQPTVWRLCRTLLQAGYLVADPSGDKYRPGLPVLTLGFAALSSLDLRELVQPDLLCVASTFGAAAGLTTREQLSMLCLQRFEAPNASLTVGQTIGSRVPIANSGAGWAYLGGLPPTQREALVAEIKRRQPALWRKVERPYKEAMGSFSRSGYMINADIIYPGLTTVAVPLARPGDGALFALNCTALSATLPADRIRRDVGPAMVDVAKRLSAALVKET